VGFPELRVGIDLLKKFFEAYSNERSDFAFVRDLQVAQLHDQQEQEDADRQVCDQEVLLEVPRPHRTQRRQNHLMVGMPVRSAFRVDTEKRRWQISSPRGR